jgi:hypothetical protein
MSDEDLYEILNRLFIVALIGSIKNDDQGESGVVPNRADHQLLELISKRTIDDEWVGPQDILDMRSGGWQRTGKLIDKGKKESSDIAAMSWPPQKETLAPSLFLFAQISATV